MNIFLYLIIFITGLFFGSFFTLAVYRIPRKEDILIKHSYCPNCNHRLGFFDLFPVFSYVFLKGRCRYCKNKIKPRYLILELCSGITFILLAVSQKFSFNNINEGGILLFTYLYVTVLFIIAGIDKENIKIQKNVLIFGFIFEIIYMIYLYTLGNVNVYQYVMYLLLFLILLILDTIILNIKIKNKYYIDILYLSLYMIIFCGSKLYVISTIFTLMSFGLYCIFRKKKETNNCIGFFQCICNIVSIILTNFMINYLL